MEVITKKSDIRSKLEVFNEVFRSSGLDALVHEVHQRLLLAKVKFPLLEFASHELFNLIPEKEQLLFCDKIEEFKTEGGNVILGIILQLRLKNHLEESFQKAAEYISNSEEWYVSDIIGERVFGFALLNWPDPVLPLIRNYINHPNNMIVRSTGAGIHYAIKKGLPKNFAAPVFELLLAQAGIKDYQAKRGIGWAAKTMARFHPDVVTLYKDQIESSKIGQWFRTKVRIGLGRHRYDQRN